MPKKPFKYKKIKFAVLNISLPDEQKKWVQRRVKEGGWGTVSEYVRELIRQDNSGRTSRNDVNTQPKPPRKLERKQIGAKYEEMIRMFQEGKELMEQRIRRENQRLSDPEIQARVASWLHNEDE